MAQRARTTKRDTAASTSMGYPSIERLLEEENPDFTTMFGRYEELGRLAKSSKSASKKGASKKASLAYQRFFELMKYLFEVKEQIVNAAKPQEEQKRKKSR